MGCYEYCCLEAQQHRLDGICTPEAVPTAGAANCSSQSSQQETEAEYAGAYVIWRNEQCQHKSDHP